MGKFKKGDEVRLINSGDYNGHGRYGKSGELGTVIQYDAVDHTYCVDFSESGRWWAKASNLEPSASTLKIEAGKFYKTRDGRKVGPIIANWCDNEHWPFRWPEQTMYYKPNGFSCPGSAHLHRDDDDIIAEWIDEPVAKPSNDNAKPKFKVGDRVKLARSFFGVAKVGATATVGKRGMFSGFVDIVWDKNSLHQGQMDGGYTLDYFELLPASPPPPPPSSP